jgi:hypothetical protein
MCPLLTNSTRTSSTFEPSLAEVECSEVLILAVQGDPVKTDHFISCSSQLYVAFTGVILHVQL